MAFPRVLATLVYAIKGDLVLLHQRVKDPNRGLWVAPGGKLEPEESPVECAIREIREETGLEITAPVLRGIMTEVSPRPDYQWITFIFAATEWSGELRMAPGIGEFRWVRTREVFDLAIPPTDRIFFRARDAPGRSAISPEVHLRRGAAHHADGRGLTSS